MALMGLEDCDATAGFSLWAPLRRAVPLALGEDRLDIYVEVLGPDAQVWIVDGTTVHAERRQGEWIIDDSPAPRSSISSDIITVFDHYGIAYRAIDLLDVTAGATGDGNLIEAPMPGLVKAVFATPGAKVAKGDRLAMLEAMKMEHVLLALRDGTVAEVLVAQGDQVSAGVALVRLEDAET